jgi:hypothetical protein
VIQNGLAERRKQLIDKTRQLSRAELLGDGGEIPYVAEHEGELADFTTQFELVRVGDDFLDDLWREVTANYKGGADSNALRLDPPYT